LLQAQAIVATAEGKPVEAKEHLEKALRLLEKQRWPIDVAEVHIALARALVQCGDSSKAHSELERARELAARMDAKGLLAEVDAELAAQPLRPA
jgi:Flp pilus assembly protein TadD